jgi:pimeloyl-ACP methyl ester carboxylesterase
MHYDRSGSGEPLVLVHGVGHNRHAWAHVVPLLERYFDVIAVDLPGHGESAPLDLAGRTVSDAFVEEFHELFDALGIDRPHVVGNSLGGRIALEMAARGEVATATALSPAGFWRGIPELVYVKSLFASASIAVRAAGSLGPVVMRSPLGGAILKVFLDSPGELSKDQITTMTTGFLTAQPALRAILGSASNFEAPIPSDVAVTVAWGTNDHVLPFKQARRAKKAIPNGSHIALKGCGHVPMSDAPELIAHLILGTAAKRQSRVAYAAQTA